MKSVYAGRLGRRGPGLLGGDGYAIAQLPHFISTPPSAPSARLAASQLQKSRLPGLGAGSRGWLKCLLSQELD